MSSYGPPLAVAVSGAALLLFGISASTDAGTVGGVALGAAILGAGLMAAFDAAKARRKIRRATLLSERAVQKIRQRQGEE